MNLGTEAGEINKRGGAGMRSGRGDAAADESDSKAAGLIGAPTPSLPTPATNKRDRRRYSAFVMASWSNSQSSSLPVDAQKSHGLR